MLCAVHFREYKASFFDTTIVLFIGFILLSGGGSEGYDYNEQIFSFQRRVLAPIIIIIALILCGISIMIKK